MTHASSHYSWAPFVAFGVIGVLTLVLRWAYSTRRDSLLSGPVHRGVESDYGLLVPVAAPQSQVAGVRARQRLEAAGIKATLTRTESGLRLLVFPVDLERARKILTAQEN
ncbi:MAG TPA: hypothetical protein VGL04_08510 [Sporichthyaceae bacterium]